MTNTLGTPIFQIPNLSSTEFLNETIKIEQEIDEINSYVKQIQTVHERLLTATSAYQVTIISKERDQLTDKLIILLTETKNRIKKIESENIKFQRNHHPDAVIRNNRHGLLKQKFTKALNTYREIEDLYMQQEKDKIIRDYQSENPEATQEDIENYLQSLNEQPMISINIQLHVEVSDEKIEQLEEEVEQRAVDLEQ
ncbi:4153_t:CDS:2, partial [Scutellospora calospora]